MELTRNWTKSRPAQISSTSVEQTSVFELNSTLFSLQTIHIMSRELLTEIFAWNVNVLKLQNKEIKTCSLSIKPGKDFQAFISSINGKDVGQLQEHT